MAFATTLVIHKAVALLGGQTGIPGAGPEIALMSGTPIPPIGPEQIVSQNIAVDVAEQSATPRYPMFYVYCERLTNSHQEKFRVFSGEAEVTVETRASQDRLENLEDQLNACVDVVTQALEENAGDWGDGVFYPGGYLVTYGAVRAGGRNFVQSAKVTFTVAVTR